jgi:hypothetical protein
MIFIFMRMLIDGVALFASVYIVNSQVAEFAKTMIVSFAIGALNFILMAMLAPTLGPFALVPVLAVDGLIVMYVLHLTLNQAALSIGIYAAYQVGMTLLMSKLFG